MGRIGTTYPVITDWVTVERVSKAPFPDMSKRQTDFEEALGLFSGHFWADSMGPVDCSGT